MRGVVMIPSRGGEVVVRRRLETPREAAVASAVAS